MTQILTEQRSPWLTVDEVCTELRIARSTWEKVAPEERRARGRETIQRSTADPPRLARHLDDKTTAWRLMASVDKKVRNRRTSWLVRWRDPTGAQRKKSFARKFEADRYRTEIERSLATGGYIDPAMSRVTVGEWSKTWL